MFAYARGRPVLGVAGQGASGEGASGEGAAGRGAGVGISLGVGAARIVAIVGPNGAGKSTLLRLMAGLLTPTSGRVTLEGGSEPKARVERDVGAIDPADRARHIAYVAQRSSIAFGFPARQVVEMGLHAIGRDDRATDDAIGMMDVSGFADRPFNTLSAGQQQRVSMARAIAQLTGRDGRARSPRFLLADEPLAALDPRHVAQTLRVFRSLAETGIGVVVVLHDLSAARWIADDAVLLDEGGTVRDAGPAERVLTPRGLEPAFGIGFDEAEIPGRVPGLVARMPGRSDGAANPGTER